MNTNETTMEERAQAELGDVVHIWMKIGKELNPVLVDFIKQELATQERTTRESIMKQIELLEPYDENAEEYSGAYEYFGRTKMIEQIRGILLPTTTSNQ